MEQPFSTSKVTVEYFDPHGVYKLLETGLVPRLPLRNLHWQSHAGPLRSIDNLHIDLVQTGNDAEAAAARQRADSAATSNDGFQTQIGAAAPGTSPEKNAVRNSVPIRRHQIPGLRRTPYLKVLLVRCDDNDAYKGGVRQEVRDWVKTNTPPSNSKKASTAENHDAYEWLIIHVVVPNTVAATQPRTSDQHIGTESKSASRWRPGSSTLLEKFRSDFNSSSKNSVDRIAQIRIGINDVPYENLPRVVPAVPSGYTESAQESEAAWDDLIAKFRSLILSSFDVRVSQYEDDIKEKDGQRSLPGWNFCTFFILKEGLARGFESVGLVEDALVGYDELGVGLDMVIQEQASGSSTTANALPSYTEELKKIALKAKAEVAGVIEYGGDDEETVDLQSPQAAPGHGRDIPDDIVISSTKKPYRELILANNVSVFDFRCYIFARQISLLLRLGNAWSTREDLLAKLREQRESVLHGVAPRAPPPQEGDSEDEELSMLAEICRRTLDFIPSVSHVMRLDLATALAEDASRQQENQASSEGVSEEIIDNMVASFAFSIAQQILAQTSTKSLPIPTTSIVPADEGQEPKAAIPEPKTMMHPARTSSLTVRTGANTNAGRPPPSPGRWPAPDGSGPARGDAQGSFLKVGLEELAATRADLYAFSRNILEQCGKKRGWGDGWGDVPVIGESTLVDMVEIDLDDESESESTPDEEKDNADPVVSVAGFNNMLLKTALDNSDDFYRLYETLTDKALRHYTVANHHHAVQARMADIAILKCHLGEYDAAAPYFWRATPVFGDSGWSLLELSMLLMYAECLKQLERKEEFVKVVLKLLSQAAAAERDRQSHRSSITTGRNDVEYPDAQAIKGFLGALLTETGALPTETHMPLASFFSSIEIDGSLEYFEGRDSASLTLKLHSLLMEEFQVDKARVRIATGSGASHKDIWFDMREAQTVKPGKTKLTFVTNTCVPGHYEITRLELVASNLSLHWKRELGQPAGKPNDILKSPHVALYHRAESLDLRLQTAKHLQLDSTHKIEVEVDSGWNAVTSAEIRVKAATGGLRLLTSEAECIGSTEFSKTDDITLFALGSIPEDSTVCIQFPYTVETDLSSVSVRIEITYTTEHGTFTFSKAPSVPISLYLGVNVQDIFKHKALFSRFTVSTATASPLRLFKSELQKSDIFDSDFGLPPTNPVVIYSKQPASLLYKIMRRFGTTIGLKTQKTMYLKLYYSVFVDEIEEAFNDSLTQAMADTPLSSFSRLVTSAMAPWIRSNLSTFDLERAALMGSLSTSFLLTVKWPKQFAGLGKGEDGNDMSANLEAFLHKWQSENPNLAVSTTESESSLLRTILIPVDIPSITIVHTADIRLDPPPPLNTNSTEKTTTPDDSVIPTVTTNQIAPASLHLKWTRIWDTNTPVSKQTDLEFSYELAAAPDTWLLGGRRKGHFVIPAPEAAADEEDNDNNSNNPEAVGLTSTPETEAEIPVLLIPLREGWLPLPGVEIREVRQTSLPHQQHQRSTAQIALPADPASLAADHNNIMSSSSGEAMLNFETDYRNLGETVRVVPDRSQVTLCLDARGGPLVLDDEMRGGLGVGVDIGDGDRAVA